MKFLLALLVCLFFSVDAFAFGVIRDVRLSGRDVRLSGRDAKVVTKLEGYTARRTGLYGAFLAAHGVQARSTASSYSSSGSTSTSTTTTRSYGSAVPKATVVIPVPMIMPPKK